MRLPVERRQHYRASAESVVKFVTRRRRSTANDYYHKSG
jgi:hypothetical protein